MDKRKEKTLEQVRKEIGIQTQDRRRFLNCLLNLDNIEKSIQLQKDHISQLKSQLASGNISEKDRHGAPMTKEQLERGIVHMEFELKKLELNLDYEKEDLYFILNVNEGLIQKAGSLEDVKKKVNAHFELIREEYEKVKKVMT